MFFFYVLLIFIIITAILIMFTNIKIHIENLKFTSKKNNGRNLNSDYKITLRLYLFRKINYLKIDITKNKMERVKLIEKIENDKNKLDIKMLKNLKYIKIENLNFKMYIDLKEAALNALIVGLFSGIISIGEGILFSQEILSMNSKNEWKIVPLYQNENILKIDFSCIINIKLIHIIYTVYRSSKNIRS